MIPSRIVRFLEHDANLAYAGTRDRNLVPHGHRVSGWQLGSDRRTLTAFVAEPLDGLLEALADNGQLAVTIEEFPSHETYQFKGKYLRHRVIEDEDLMLVDRIRDRWIKRMRSVEPDAPPSVLRDFILTPALAVEFEVRDVYVQTPGPGAGSRVEPEAATR